jgi:hypothetical protein
MIARVDLIWLIGFRGEDFQIYLCTLTRDGPWVISFIFVSVDPVNGPTWPPYYNSECDTCIQKATLKFPPNWLKFKYYSYSYRRVEIRSKYKLIETSVAVSVSVTAIVLLPTNDMSEESSMVFTKFETQIFWNKVVPVFATRR